MSCKAITDGNKCKQRDRNFKKVWKRSARSTELWHKWRMFLMDLPIALSALSKSWDTATNSIKYM